MIKKNKNLIISSLISFILICFLLSVNYIDEIYKKNNIKIYVNLPDSILLYDTLLSINNKKLSDLICGQEKIIFKIIKIPFTNKIEVLISNKNQDIAINEMDKILNCTKIIIKNKYMNSPDYLLVKTDIENIKIQWTYKDLIDFNKLKYESEKIDEFLKNEHKIHIKK
jgi:hypothetical protein